MSDWTLRRAAAGDANAASLIASASFLETFAGILAGDDIVAHCATNCSVEKFEAWLGDGASIVTLAGAMPGGAPIGYSLLTEPDLPVEPRAGDVELKRIYALSRWHGTGLGAALMRQAIEDARASGATRLLLGVYGQNARAQRFYEKQGFEVIGTRQFLVGATLHDDLVFSRSL